MEELPQEAREMLKAVRGDSIFLKLDTVWKDLQQHIDHVLDAEMNKQSSKGGNTWGFKQVIERKQGLFRMNMQGKRVNFAARYVKIQNMGSKHLNIPNIRPAQYIFFWILRFHKSFL